MSYQLFCIIQKGSPVIFQMSLLPLSSFQIRGHILPTVTAVSCVHPSCLSSCLPIIALVQASSSPLGYCRHGCQSPQDHSQVQGCAGRIHRIRPLVTAKLQCNERIKAKAAEGSGTWSKVCRKLSAGFQKSSPKEVTQDMLNSSSNEL